MFLKDVRNAKLSHYAFWHVGKHTRRHLLYIDKMWKDFPSHES